MRGSFVWKYEAKAFRKRLNTVMPHLNILMMYIWSGAVHIPCIYSHARQELL